MFNMGGSGISREIYKRRPGLSVLLLSLLILIFLAGSTSADVGTCTSTRHGSCQPLVGCDCYWSTSCEESAGAAPENFNDVIAGLAPDPALDAIFCLAGDEQGGTINLDATVCCGNLGNYSRCTGGNCVGNSTRSSLCIEPGQGCCTLGTTVGTYLSCGVESDTIFDTAIAYNPTTQGCCTAGGASLNPDSSSNSVITIADVPEAELCCGESYTRTKTCVPDPWGADDCITSTNYSLNPGSGPECNKIVTGQILFNGNTITTTVKTGYCCGEDTPYCIGNNTADAECVECTDAIQCCAAACPPLDEDCILDCSWEPAPHVCCNNQCSTVPCCPNGDPPCGGIECCNPATEECIDDECCPNERVIGGECCEVAKVCGDNCCGADEFCADPNAEVAPPAFEDIVAGFSDDTGIFSEFSDSDSGIVANFAGVGLCCPNGQKVCTKPSGKKFCCNATSTCCGNRCCSDTKFCASVDQSLCCKNGYQVCTKPSGTKFCCVPDGLCCQSKCCRPGVRRCCEGYCCPENLNPGCCPGDNLCNWSSTMCTGSSTYQHDMARCSGKCGVYHNVTFGDCQTICLPLIQYILSTLCLATECTVTDWGSCLSTTCNGNTTSVTSVSTTCHCEVLVGPNDCEPDEIQCPAYPNCCPPGEMCIDPETNKCCNLISYGTCEGESCIFSTGCEGEVTSECSSDIECQDPVCGNGVVESGEECEGDSDCSAGEECVNCDCEPGQGTVCNDSDQCEASANPADDECYTDADCDGEHSECDDSDMCVTVAGEDVDGCDTDDDCQSHNQCLDETGDGDLDTCGPVPGSGTDDCSSDPECIGHYYACNSSGQCILFTGSEDNSCIDDDDCYVPPSHNICILDQCISAPGGGIDECSTDADCDDQHRACIGVSCVIFPFPGDDSCFLDSDCAGDCGNGTLDPGEECEADADCELGEVCVNCECEPEEDTYNICVGETCTPVVGTGTDDCLTDADCEDTHYACNWDDEECVLLSGDGIDSCTFDSDCVPVGSCGDGTVDAGEECGEPGLSCSAGEVCVNCSCELGTGANCIGCYCFPDMSGETTCLTNEDCCWCGDGIVNGSEQCESDSDCGADEICVNCDCVPSFTGANCAGCFCTPDMSGVITCFTDEDCCWCGDGIINGSEQCEFSSDCFGFPNAVCIDCKCNWGFTGANCVGPFCTPDMSGETTCYSDGDCMGGPVCGNGTVELPEECEFDSDCGASEVCINCECVLGEDTTCGTGGQLGKCVTCSGFDCDGCMTDLECAVCGDGDIEPGEQCGEPGLPSCPSGYECLDCRCVLEYYLDCLADMCLPATGPGADKCSTDEDCVSIYYACDYDTFTCEEYVGISSDECFTDAECVPLADDSMLEIASFDIDPSTIFLGDKPNGIFVLVENLEYPATPAIIQNCSVVVTFFDSDNTPAAAAPVFRDDIDFSAEFTNVVFDVANLPEADFSRLSEGIYSARSYVICSDGLHDSESTNFAIVLFRRFNIPETSVFGILLVLFSALLVFKFAGRIRKD